MLTSTTADFKTVSGSSCLNVSDENFVTKVPQTGQKLSDYYQLFLGNKEEDGEIGVFQAEKYFNDVMDHSEQDKASVLKADVVVGDNFHHMKCQDGEQDIVIELKRRPKLQKPCTPSIVSAESSANSQSVLLRKNPRNTIQRKPDWTHGCRGFLTAAICCKCSISDGGFNGVHRNLGGDLAPASTGEVVHSGSDPWISKDMVQRQKLVHVRAQMSEEQANNKNALRLGKGVAMLSSEFTARKEDFETESNASSELFEIESLTGKVRSRQTSDAASDFCPTVPAAAGYAPSEVSIQWSVITESAADNSVVSDFDVGGERQRGAQVGCAAVAKSDGGGERRRLGGGGALLGCKSEKAVKVAGDALRSVSWKYGQVGEERRRGAAALTVRNPVARFQAETRLTGFDGKRGSHLLSGRI